MGRERRHGVVAWKRDEQTSEQNRWFDEVKRAEPYLFGAGAYPAGVAKNCNKLY